MQNKQILVAFYPPGEAGPAREGPPPLLIVVEQANEPILHSTVRSDIRFSELTRGPKSLIHSVHTSVISLPGGDHREVVTERINSVPALIQLCRMFKVEYVALTFDDNVALADSPAKLLSPKFNDPDHVKWPSVVAGKGHCAQR